MMNEQIFILIPIVLILAGVAAYFVQNYGKAMVPQNGELLKAKNLRAYAKRQETARNEAERKAWEAYRDSHMIERGSLTLAIAKAAGRGMPALRLWDTWIDADTTKLLKRKGYVISYGISAHGRYFVVIIWSERKAFKK